MAGVFLHIELLLDGINAKVIELNTAKTLIRDECRVSFENLEVPEESASIFAAALANASQKIDFAGCSEAVVMVHDAQISYRNLKLPFETEKKIAQVLPFELETLLPITEEAYLSDFLKLEFPSGPGWILSASLSEKKIQEYFEALENFGIRAVKIVPKGYMAAVNFSHLKNAIDQFIFIYMAQEYITLTVVHNSTPCMVRHFSAKGLTGEQVCEQIRKTLYGLNQQTGFDEGFELYICSDDESEARRNEIYEAFDQILEGRDIPANRFKIEAEGLICQVTPLKRVKAELDFCKGPYRQSSFLQKYRSRLMVTAALVVLTIALALISVALDNAKLDRQVASLDAQAAAIFEQTFPGKKASKDPYLEMKGEVNKRMKEGSSGTITTGSNIRMVSMLAEISRKIDPGTDTEITRFLFSQDRLILSGATQNFNNVDQMKVRLESSPLFKKVSISSAASDKKTSRINFKFIIEV